ncbi:MAG: hypothetical protein IKP74_07625 [Clostridia bacterium]|nr:hypothetical protein [Clostridia bacterium]
MITVIDRTLSILKAPSSPEALRRLADAIFQSGADVLELSEDNYRILSTEKPDGRFLLRLERGSSPASFPGVKRFVSTGSAAGNVVLSEEYIVKDASLILSGAVPPVLRPVRLSLSTPTLDCHPGTLFSAIRNTFLGHVEFAPHGDSGIATSLCAEWALSDGNLPVTTVSGIGGYASLSDLTVFLRSIRRRRPAETPFPAEELLARLSEAFPDEPIPASEMKVSPSSSIHILKFRLEQLGFGGSPAKLKSLSSRIRAGHKTPSPYLDEQAIYAVSRQID